MLKRLLALLMVIMLLSSLACTTAFAKAKQMNDDVPVWSEDTVRQYAADYVAAKSMDRLWGYFDLQIRRYMPMETFESLLIDLHWLTGDFVSLGTYNSFSEPSEKLKTHILHFCMEKQDVDMYLTHKDKQDDWEIMAVEFVPAAKQAVPAAETVSMLVSDEESGSASYREIPVQIGQNPYQLNGLLTIPNAASAEAPVPACILIHDSGALDLNMSTGKTTMFKDLAEEFAKMDIATIRYDKRTFAYPDAVIETVWDEVVEDALAAVTLLHQEECIDSNRIVVLGVGFGAMLAPRIASQSDGKISGMILIGGTPETLIEVDFTKNKDSVAVLPKEEAEVIKNAVRKMNGMKEEAVRDLELFGRTGYYYWEATQYDAIKLIKKLRIPVLFTQGKRDPIVNSNEEGVLAYKEQIGIYKALYTYEPLMGLNHLLMDDLTVNQFGLPEYAVETHVDKYAAMTLAQWVLALNVAE